MAASGEHDLNNSASIPTLESGDRLTRHEFERRYTAMPNKKAELIESDRQIPDIFEMSGILFLAIA